MGHLLPVRCAFLFLYFLVRARFAKSLSSYSPSTVTNSRTDAADFCSAAFSSAVSLI
jgi:hypothetical protein